MPELPCFFARLQVRVWQLTVRQGFVSARPYRHQVVAALFTIGTHLSVLQRKQFLQLVCS